MGSIFSKILQQDSSRKASNCTLDANDMTNDFLPNSEKMLLAKKANDLAFYLFMILVCKSQVLSLSHKYKGHS